KVSPVKERKDSSDSEEDLPTPEVKDTTSIEGASDALVPKGKEPVVSEAAVAAATPKRKRAGKEKVERGVEKKKEKVTKKQKKQAPKIARKWVVQEEDDEETDEEPLQLKRKRTETDKDQPEPKKMFTKAETGNIHSSEDTVLNSQAQNPPNQPLPEIDIDPALLQPINIAYPAQTSELPPITSATDLDTVAEGIKIATEIQKNKT
ncbi:hypothetical protein A2U01_0042303, partial [Trifolium medium]|nr:hypothetical protein [Trifolium medium]